MLLCGNASVKSRIQGLLKKKKCSSESWLTRNRLYYILMNLNKDNRCINEHFSFFKVYAEKKHNFCDEIFQIIII